MKKRITKTLVAIMASLLISQVEFTLELAGRARGV